MQPPTAAADLLLFRAVIDPPTVGQRKESLCDLVDAILTSAGPATVARRRLAPGFRRRWSSVADALRAGRLDVPLLRRRLVAALPRAPADGRPVWALDASTWPRHVGAAQPSAERTAAPRVAAGTPPRGVLAGWE